MSDDKRIAEYSEQDCRNLADLHPPRCAYENDLQNAIRALVNRSEQAREVMRRFLDERQKYEDACQEEGIPLREYNHERFLELSEPTRKAMADMRRFLEGEE